VAELETLVTKEGDWTVSLDHWDEPVSRDDCSDDDDAASIQPLMTAVRDLSLDVAGSYIGGASAITLGRALQSTLAGKIPLTLPSYVLEKEYLPSAQEGNDAGLFDLGQLGQGITDQMAASYLKHLCTNFPIMYSYDVLALHTRRHELTSIYDQCILALVYSLGGHFLEKTGESAYSFNPEAHYEFAWEHREAILEFRDSRSLTYLLLLGQHCYRMPKDPGSWTFFGLAMKQCIELGLHRKRRSSRLSLRSELDKRVFWSCYWHEREIAMAMGRPPAISDHDIDVPLPLDVDEANQSVDELRNAMSRDQPAPSQAQSTMSTFIHLLRLKRLESDIQHKIYRVDHATSPVSINAMTHGFLEKLYAWKEAIPSESTEINSPGAPYPPNHVYCSYDSYMASYHKTMRVLLQPRLYEKSVSERYFDLCAEACRGLLETYKRLHCRLPIAFTSLSLQSVFLSGLTLVYCLWHSSNSQPTFRSLNALNDCSIILYVMAERWSASRKYRDLFEAIKRSVIEAIEQGKHMSGKALPSMKSDMQRPLEKLEPDETMQCVNDDLQQMMSDMMGEQVSLWPDAETISEPDNPASLFRQPENDAQMFSQLEWASTADSSWYDNSLVSIAPAAPQ
jgi:hypothetical protein